MIFSWCERTGTTTATAANACAAGGGYANNQPGGGYANNQCSWEMILKNKQQQATCMANAMTAMPTPAQRLRKATPTLSTHQWSGEIMIST